MPSSFLILSSHRLRSFLFSDCSSTAGRCCVALLRCFASRACLASPRPSRPASSLFPQPVYLPHNLLLLPSTVLASFLHQLNLILSLQIFQPLFFSFSLLFPTLQYHQIQPPPSTANPSIHLFVPRLCRNPLTTHCRPRYLALFTRVSR